MFKMLSIIGMLFIRFGQWLSSIGVEKLKPKAEDILTKTMTNAFGNSDEMLDDYVSQHVTKMDPNRDYGCFRRADNGPAKIDVVRRAEYINWTNEFLEELRKEDRLDCEDK